MVATPKEILKSKIKFGSKIAVGYTADDNYSSFDNDIFSKILHLVLHRHSPEASFTAFCT